MGCCKCLFGSFFTLILILLNIPLVLIGITFIFFGIMTAFFFPTLVSWFWWAFSTLPSEDQAVVNNFLEYVDAYALGAGIALLVCGIFMFFIAFLGGFGACCANTCMMTVYAILIGIMALGSIVTSIIFLIDSSIIVDPLESEALRLITDHFDDPDNPARQGNFTDIDPVMMAYTSIFRMMQCCGVTNYTDYDVYANIWKRQYVYSSTSTVQNAKVPVLCCKETKRVNSTVTGFSYYQPGKDTLDTSCLSNPTKDNANIERSCIAYLTSGTTSALAWFVFGTAIGLLILFGVSLFLAIWYKKKEQRSNDMHMSNKYA